MRSFTTTDTLQIEANPTSFTVAIKPTNPTAMLALFPKSAGLKLGTISSPDEPSRPYISGYASFTANGVNGGVNETGVKRFKAIVKAAQKAGIPIVMDQTFQNSFETLAEALHQFIEIA